MPRNTNTLLTTAIALLLSGAAAAPARADLLDQLLGAAVPSGQNSQDTASQDTASPTADSGGQDTQGQDTQDLWLTESEPNDDQGQAVAMQPGVLYHGEVDDIWDRDWYRLRSDRAGVVMTLGVEANRDRMRITVQDAEGRVLTRLAGGEKKTDYIISLPHPGEWFLVVDSIKKGFAYQIQASGDGLSFPGDIGTQPDDFTEIEPNDDPDNAQPVVIGSPQAAMIEPENPDYWSFFAATAEDAVLNLSGDFPGGATLDLLRSTSLGQVETVRSVALVSGVHNLVLPLPGSGAYMLKFSSPAAGAYRFTLNGDNLHSLSGNRFFQLAANAQLEGEPNDGAFNADTPFPGKPVFGRLSGGGQDWFAYRSLRAGAIVSIEAPKPPVPWVLQVRDSGGNVLDQVNVADGGLYDFRIPDQGVFYLTASPDGDNPDASYVFNVTATGEVAAAEGGGVKGNFHDVEVEPNDTSDGANPLSNLVMMQGQTQTASDMDLFRIDSAGGEILSVELCPDQSACAAQIADTAPWAVYVFSGNPDLAQSVPLADCTPHSSSHPYLLYSQGRFSNLIGVIDPNFGSGTKIEVALPEPGTYYIGVSPVLKRDENGSTILVETGKSCGQDDQGNEITVDRQFIVAEPFVTDPYQIRVAQSGLPPLSAEAGESGVSGTDSIGIWDPKTLQLTLPKVVFDGKTWSALLYRLDDDGSGAFRLKLADAQVTGTWAPSDTPEDSLIPTFDGTRLHIPVIRVQGGDRVFSADLVVRDVGVFVVENLVEQPL